MSSQPDTQFHSDLDSSPLLLPAKVLRNDTEALQAARELAEVAREQAARRDQQRKLPWAEIELFTRSGLGSISVPKAHGGPEVSFETVAEVFRLISAGDPALVQRLYEMGLLEGDTVEVIGVAPLGDPIEVRIGGTRLSLRRREAAAVTLSPG